MSSTNYENTNKRYVVLQRARQMLEEEIIKKIAEKNPEYLKRHSAEINSLVESLLMPISVAAEMDSTGMENPNLNRSLEHESSVLQMNEILFNPENLNAWAKDEAQRLGVSEKDIKSNFEYKFKYAMYVNAIEAKNVLNRADIQFRVPSGVPVDITKDEEVNKLVQQYCARMDGIVDDVLETIINPDPSFVHKEYQNKILNRKENSLQNEPVFPAEARLNNVLQGIVSNKENGLSASALQACYAVLETINNPMLSDADKINFNKIMKEKTNEALDNTCLNSIEVSQKIFMQEMENLKNEKDSAKVEEQIKQALARLESRNKQIEEFRKTSTIKNKIAQYKADIASGYLDSQIEKLGAGVTREKWLAKITNINEKSSEEDMFYCALYMASNVTSEKEIKKVYEILAQYEECFGFSNIGTKAVKALFEKKAPNEEKLINDEEYRVKYSENHINEYLDFTATRDSKHVKFLAEQKRSMGSYLGQARKLDSEKVNAQFEDFDMKDWKWGKEFDTTETVKTEEKPHQETREEKFIREARELINAVRTSEYYNNPEAELKSPTDKLAKLVENYVNFTKDVEEQLSDIYGDKYNNTSTKIKGELEKEAREQNKIRSLTEKQKQEFLAKMEELTKELSNDYTLVSSDMKDWKWEEEVQPEKEPDVSYVSQAYARLARFEEIESLFPNSIAEAQEIKAKLESTLAFYAKNSRSVESQLIEINGDKYTEADPKAKKRMELHARNRGLITDPISNQQIEQIVRSLPGMCDEMFAALPRLKPELTNPDRTPLSDENRTYLDSVPNLAKEVNELLSQKINSTGDPEKDKALNEAKNELRTQFLLMMASYDMYSSTCLTEEQQLVVLYGDKFLNETDPQKLDAMRKEAKEAHNVYSASAEQRKGLLDSIIAQSDKVATMYYQFQLEIPRDKVGKSKEEEKTPDTPKPTPDKQDDKDKNKAKKDKNEKEYDASMGRLAFFLKKDGILNSVRATGIFLFVMSIAMFVSGAWVAGLAIAGALAATAIADVQYTVKAKNVEEQLNDARKKVQEELNEELSKAREQEKQKEAKEKKIAEYDKILEENPLGMTYVEPTQEQGQVLEPQSQKKYENDDTFMSDFVNMEWGKDDFAPTSDSGNGSDSPPPPNVPEETEQEEEETITPNPEPAQEDANQNTDDTKPADNDSSVPPSNEDKNEKEEESKLEPDSAPTQGNEPTDSGSTSTDTGTDSKQEDSQDSGSGEEQKIEDEEQQPVEPVSGVPPVKEDDSKIEPQKADEQPKVYDANVVVDLLNANASLQSAEERYRFELQSLIHLHKYEDKTRIEKMLKDIQSTLQGVGELYKNIPSLNEIEELKAIAQSDKIISSFKHSLEALNRDKEAVEALSLEIAKELQALINEVNEWTPLENENESYYFGNDRIIALVNKMNKLMNVTGYMNKDGEKIAQKVAIVRQTGIKGLQAQELQQVSERKPSRVSVNPQKAEDLAIYGAVRKNIENYNKYSKECEKNVAEVKSIMDNFTTGKGEFTVNDIRNLLNVLLEFKANARIYSENLKRVSNLDEIANICKINGIEFFVSSVGEYGWINKERANLLDWLQKSSAKIDLLESQLREWMNCLENSNTKSIFARRKAQAQLSELQTAALDSFRGVEHTIIEVQSSLRNLNLRNEELINVVNEAEKSDQEILKSQENTQNSKKEEKAQKEPANQKAKDEKVQDATQESVEPEPEIPTTIEENKTEKIEEMPEMVDVAKEEKANDIPEIVNQENEPMKIDRIPKDVLELLGKARKEGQEQAEDFPEQVVDVPERLPNEQNIINQNINNINNDNGMGMA